MANPKPPARRTGLLIGVGVVIVLILGAVVVGVDLSSGGHTTSTSTSSAGSVTSVTSSTTTVTCTGSSTSQTITIISGPVVVGTTGDVSAGVKCANGQLGTILNYNYGQPINIAVTVTNTALTPTAISTVLDGNPQGTNPWNVTSTGYTYVLGFGGAGESALTACAAQSCTHDIYATITFSNNTNATSNVVYFSVYT